MESGKKNKLILTIVIVIVVLGAVAYYYLVEKKAEAIVWDGTYQMAGNLTCEGNIPNLTTIPMTSTLTVTNNKIVEEFQGEVKNFQIDKRGKATETIEPTDFGNGVTASGEGTYQFSKKGDAYKFTAEITMDVGAAVAGQTYSSTCSGPITGARQ